MRILLLVLGVWASMQGIDDWVQHAVQGARHPGLERPMRAATDLGRPSTYFGALLGIAVLGGPSGVATARLALLAAAPVNLAVETIKRSVNRARPDGEHHRSNASFPSSHAANAFALALVFANRWRRAAALFWLGAAVIGFSRIYLDRHFLSDVVVGAAIGWLGAWIVVRLAAARESGREGRRA